MVDPVLASILQSLTLNIVSLMTAEIELEYKLGSQLQRLKACVMRMESTIKDMEGRQERSAAAGTILHQLRDVAYDANNLLDEFKTEVKRRTSLGKVRNSLSSVNPMRSIFRHKLASGIKDVDDRVTAIARDNGLNPGNIDPTMHQFVHTGQSSIVSSISTSIRGGSEVYGREQDLKTIVEHLKTEGNTIANPSVFPILAMGGIGKSTLAREVYHGIRGHFAVQMWVHVSRNFDIIKLMRSMVFEIQGDATPPQMHMWDLPQLQRHLRGRLSGMKYLLVLDDMWDENPSDWECLKTTLLVGARGSWIIVTTRSKLVAEIVGTVQPFCLGGLSHGHCWSIFAEHAFEDEKEWDKYPELLEIGHAIAKKCNGSPLAAKVLGSRLSTKRESREWQHVLDCNFSEENSEILQTLQISYNLLPEHLKHCFRFCSIFPKGFQFQRDVLILLWMAQEFIHPQGSHKRKEDVGHEYFNCLLQGSFFQQSPNDPNMYIMHDLIHDMAQLVSKDECGIIEHGKADNFPEKVRHLSVFCNHNNSKSSLLSSSSSRASSSSSPCLKSAYTYKHLYTLVFLSNSKGCFLGPPDSLHKHYKHLHALDLSNTSIHILKNDISKLKYLRCLNLSNTKIESLPKSINGLLNLQSLLLRNCYKLKDLPRSVRSLCNLRHLDLQLDTDFAEMDGGTSQSVHGGGLISLPDDIGKLTQLQTLSRFVLKKKRYCGIKQLENLNEIHGDLLLIDLQVISEVGEVASAKLSNKMHIDRLKLQWTEENSFPQEGIVEGILEQLRPNSQLKELWIEGYSGIYLARWIDGLNLAKLVHFMLSNCKRCRQIPSLGQL